MKPTNSRIMTQQEKLKKDILNEVLNCIAQKEPDAEKCTDYIIGIISDVIELVEKLTATKTFDVDCGGQVMVRFEITNNTPVATMAMDGGGNAMSMNKFIINKPII